MRDVDVAPPATNTWTVDDVAASALAVLRLSNADVDADRVEQKAVAACLIVDRFVDHAEPIAPTATMFDSAVQVTVELYRRKDAPFGVADAWSSDTVAANVSPSPLHGVRSELLGDKARWGMA